jgi:ABC-type sugar transport system ATPase subunit
MRNNAITGLDLKVQGVTKAYAGVVALQDVTLAFKRGGIHALVGENGAGKTTLIEILGGGLQQDAGKIFIDDQEVKIRNPAESHKLGISIIHQEFSLVSALTVAENIFLGREPRAMRHFVDKRQLRRNAEVLLQPFNVNISSSAIVEDLTTAQQQIVEIAKAISLNARMLIMDEPTASLSEHEVTNLHNIIRLISRQGTTILYVSHKVEEVFSLCETVTILRDGKVAGAHKVSGVDQDTVVREIIGRELDKEYGQKAAEYGPEVLRVEKLTKRGVYENISFSVRAGEIVGLFGFVGAKRTDVLRAIFAADRADSGHVFVRGKIQSDRSSPNAATTKKIAFIPEDRKRQGLLLSASILDNAALVLLKNLPRRWWLSRARASKAVLPSLTRLRVKYTRLRNETDTLSGGNQQKLVLSKWLSSDSELWLMDEPTRGVDVGSKAEIHRAISDLAAEVKAIVLVSSELSEIIGLSDRVIVMHEGKITGQLDPQEYNPERIMHLAAGNHVDKYETDMHQRERGSGGNTY